MAVGIIGAYYNGSAVYRGNTDTYFHRLPPIDTKIDRYFGTAEANKMAGGMFLKKVPYVRAFYLVDRKVVGGMFMRYSRISDNTKFSKKKYLHVFDVVDSKVVGGMFCSTTHFVFSLVPEAEGGPDQDEGDIVLQQPQEGRACARVRPVLRLHQDLPTLRQAQGALHQAVLS